MEPSDKQKSSGSKAAIVGAGIICSFVGAVIGAVGYHLWQKDKELEQQQRHKSHRSAYNDGPCPICLDEMDELIVLECGHQYHKNCTKQLQDSERTPKCPICRKQISE